MRAQEQPDYLSILILAVVIAGCMWLANQRVWGDAPPQTDRVDQTALAMVRLAELANPATATPSVEVTPASESRNLSVLQAGMLIAVRSETISFRALPGLDQPIVQQFPQGTVFEIVTIGDHGWYQLRSSDGHEGWAYIQEVQS